AGATQAVVTADSVKDRLDVVTALSAGKEAKITLADGTQLRVGRTSSGAASGLPIVTADALAACDGCMLATGEGDVGRLRITSASTTSVTIAQDDVQIEVSSPEPRRYRFDIRRLR